MHITHKFELDFLEKDGMQKLSAMQCDGGTRAVEVTLLEGGEPWTPAGATASVAFRNLKDGHKGWYDKLPDGSAACTINGNVVTAILAPAVLSAAGEVRAAIVFQDADLNQLATFGFSILIEPNPAAGSAIHNDYYAYSTMEDVSAAVDAMLDSLAVTKDELGQLVVQVNEAVAQVQQEAGSAIVCEAAGEVIAVSDASDRAVQGLTIYGKTTQDGTPSPDAPVELVSVGNGGSIGVTVEGKNLIDPAAYLIASNNTTLEGDVFTTIVESGTIYVNNLSKSPISHQAGQYTLTIIPVTDVYLTVHVYNAETKTRITYKDMGAGTGVYAWTFSTQVPFILSVGGWYDVTASAAKKGTFSFKLQLEAGATATQYEQYKAAQALSLSTPNGLPGIPVASAGNYTDESGQAWICDEIDLARGVYVQRIGSAGLGILTWTYADYYWRASALANMQCYGNANPSYVLAEKYKATYANVASVEVNTIALANSSYNTAPAMFIYCNNGSTTESPTGNCYYELVTPIETALDADTLAAYAALHSNKPNTTVFNDAGAGQKLGYVADTKLYIDNKFTEMTNAIIASGANI